MSGQHTPGPWEPATGYSDAFYQIGKMLGIPAQDKSPSEVWHEQMRPVLEQRLKAYEATAELLEALIELERVYELGDFETEFQPALVKARAAIAKATGADVGRPVPDHASGPA